jgi:lysophospholipase L1-like esterase
MGYQDVVRRELAGQADLCTSEENGGNSERVLGQLDAWVISQKPDIVHINCGLHDLRTELGNDKPAIPLPAYEANLRKIFSRLQNETRGTVIWTTTTPVNEAWHHATKGFDRWDANVAAYNATALKVAQEFKLEVDDLFVTVMKAGRDRLLSPDGVHYKPEGYEVLGQAVAEKLKKFLS